MGDRSKVMLLPPELRAELDRRLIANAFGGYQQLAEWLTAEGYQISHASVHRYGQKFEERMAAIRIATEQAKSISEALGDDQNQMGDALIALCQQKAFDVLMQIDQKDISLPAMAKAIADLNRSSVQQKKWMQEFKSKLTPVVDEAEKLMRQEGISDATAALIRQKFLGLVS